MAKTRISMDETKAICRYFNYLKRKYKINNSQLYNHCPDGPNQGGLTYKTIQAYLPEDQTGSRNPKHAFSNNTLNCLIESFSNILAVQGIAIPPELSTNFLLSSRLHLLKHLKMIMLHLLLMLHAMQLSYMNHRLPLLIQRLPKKNLSQNITLSLVIQLRITVLQLCYFPSVV